MLSQDKKFQVQQYYHVYRNCGSLHIGKWVYQPWNFDSSFELWSKAYPTKKAAYEAAYAELREGAVDLSGSLDAGPYADWQPSEVIPPEPKDERSALRQVRDLPGAKGKQVFRSGKPQAG